MLQCYIHCVFYLFVYIASKLLVNDLIDDLCPYLRLRKKKEQRRPISSILMKKSYQRRRKRKRLIDGSREKVGEKFNSPYLHLFNVLAEIPEVFLGFGASFLNIKPPLPKIGR